MSSIGPKSTRLRLEKVTYERLRGLVSVAMAGGANRVAVKLRSNVILWPGSSRWARLETPDTSRRAQTVDHFFPT